MTTTGNVMPEPEEPSEKRFREIIVAPGSLPRAETGEDEAMVQRVIAEYREEERQKQG